MANKALTHSFTLTARYAETDAQGVVHHSNYLVWFEEGRSDFLRQKVASIPTWSVMASL